METVHDHLPTVSIPPLQYANGWTQRADDVYVKSVVISGSIAIVAGIVLLSIGAMFLLFCAATIVSACPAMVVNTIDVRRHARLQAQSLQLHVNAVDDRIVIAAVDMDGNEYCASSFDIDDELRAMEYAAQLREEIAVRIAA